MRETIVALQLLAFAGVIAPTRAIAAEPPCPPKVTFQWVSSTIVKMWTDAEFASSTATPTTPDPEIDAMLASMKLGQRPPGGDPQGATTVAGNDDPHDAAQYPVIVRVGQGRPVFVRRAASHTYVSRDKSQGSTFLLDLSDQPLVSHGGRAEVILRYVLCPGNQVRTVHVGDVVVAEQHHITVDVGVSFSLDRDGKFPSSPEYSLNSYSRWAGPFSSAVDLRITTLEKVATDSNATQDSFLKHGGNTLDASGRLFFNFDPRWRKLGAPEGTQPCLAAVAGAGIRSVPGEHAVDARFRYFGGLRFQVLGYNSDDPAEGFGESRSHIEVGYARDFFWRDTIEHRVYGTAQLEIPKIGGKYVRFVGRVTVDRPTHFGNTSASEIRMSVLSSVNPAVLGALLGFSPSTASP